MKDRLHPASRISPLTPDPPRRYHQRVGEGRQLRQAK